MPILLFLVAALILWLEGLFLWSIFFSRDRVGGVVLGYPLGVFINCPIFFLLTVAQVPLSQASLGIGHGLVLAVLGLIVITHHSRSTEEKPVHVLDPVPSRWIRPMTIACLVLLGLVLVSAVARAAFLPTFYVDSFKNWHMRSELSFAAHHVLFNGIEKPQYPILMHSVQMVYAFVINQWNDTAANVSTLLLSLSAFGGVFVLTKRIAGRTAALLACTLLMAVPLVIIHLGQGYADIHVVEYMLLSALLFSLFIRNGDYRNLIFSAIFCAAAAWTKVEGITYGVLPWCAMLGLSFFFHPRARRAQLLSLGLLLILVLPWPIYIHAIGVSLNSHHSSFGWQPGVMRAVVTILFGQGSFGLHWYAIPVSLFLLLIGRRSDKPFFERNMLLLWGLCTLALVLATYFFTSESEGLFNQQSFNRVMMLPTLLLVQAILLRWMTTYSSHTTPLPS